MAFGKHTESPQDALLHALWEEKPLLHILDTQKHPQPHMHKHADSWQNSENHQGAMSQTNGTKEFEHKGGPLSVTSQVKKNKKMKQLMMNYS